MNIAVITPTIPGREKLLEECKASVAAQTLPPGQHLVQLDNRHAGLAAMRNEMVASLPPHYDWIAFLDDDDLMLPNHLATLAAGSDEADIIYSDCQTQGFEKNWEAGSLNLEKLKKDNYIPATVLMRRSLFKRVGGFRSGQLAEDWDLWLRCAAAGASFAYMARQTWVYRRQPDGLVNRIQASRQPVISLFTPTNNPSFLPELYQSLTAQSYPYWEWVVLVNNGASFSSSDPRVKIYADHTGLGNVGYLKHAACRHATGDVLFEMDHDDLLLPGALEECAKAFMDPSVDFAYSNTVNHDVRNDQPVFWSEQYGWSSRPFEFKGKRYVEAISAAPEPQSISRIWFAPNHFRAWRTSFYWRIGGHNGAMKISDDHDLMMRTYVQGKMVHIDKPLYFYRVHGANTWLQHQQEIQDTMWAVHDHYIDAMARKWAAIQGLRCIDLCGGIDKPPGYESVDKVNGDIVADLDRRWPLADNSVGVIRAHDALEHMVNPIHTMNEAWRVLAHGGFFLIQVPSTRGEGAWCDPTHRSFWNRRSFRYYTEAGMRKYLEGSGCRCRFQAIKLVDCTLYEDQVPYVIAHLVAIKQDQPRFYGALHI